MNSCFWNDWNNLSAMKSNPHKCLSKWLILTCLTLISVMGVYFLYSVAFWFNHYSNTCFCHIFTQEIYIFPQVCIADHFVQDTPFWRVPGWGEKTRFRNTNNTQERGSIVCSRSVFCCRVRWSWHKTRRKEKKINKGFAERYSYTIKGKN